MDAKLPYIHTLTEKEIEIIVQILLRRLDENKNNEEQEVQYLKYLNQIFQIYPEQLTEDIIRNISFVGKHYYYSVDISLEISSIFKLYQTI